MSEFAKYVVWDIWQGVFEINTSLIVAPTDEGDSFHAKSIAINKKGEN